jgi:hypothetical protein
MNTEEVKTPKPKRSKLKPIIANEEAIKQPTLPVGKLPKDTINPEDDGPGYHEEDGDEEQGKISDSLTEEMNDASVIDDEDLKAMDETGAIVSEEADKVTENKNLLPIFIGCANKDIVNQINSFLWNVKTGDINYEIVVMNGDLLEKSTETWLFQKMSEEQQRQLEAMRIDNKIMQQALIKAREVDRLLRSMLRLPTPEEDPTGVYMFKRYDVKAAYERFGRKLMSRKEVRELLDLLSLRNLVQPTSMNVPYEKQEWQFTFDDYQHLDNTDQLIIQTMAQQKNIENQLSLLKTNKELIMKRLSDAEDGKDNNTTGLPGISSGSRESPEAYES